jgi:hypothetical protein
MEESMAFPNPGKLPSNTPLAALGFTPAQLAKMTPAARRLTKGDLISLQKWDANGGKGAAPDHLTIADLKSLQSAIGSPKIFVARAKAMRRADGGTSYCCCCSPCCTCTAAAEISPIRFA